MAALAMVGTIFMGCVGEEMANEAPQTKTNNTVTQTTTISLDSSAGTRALDADGKKTFAKDDQIAILYKDANNMSQKAIATLKDTDISSDGKTAKITVTLDNPKASGQLRCIYPAVMLSGYFDPDQNPDIDDANTINYQMLLNQQDGILATIASKYDLAVFDGTFTSDAELPGSITLKNQLAIVAFTIKDYDGNDITSTITNLEIDQGPGLFGYSLARTAAAGPIYVAMMPSENAKEDINITAFDGTTIYEKTAKDVTLAANSLYPVTATLADIQHTPLTLEATEDGTTVTAVCGYEIAFQYAINGGTKIDVHSEGGGESFNIKLDAGEFVEFYSKRYNVGEYRLRIFPDKETYVYGNVMSLIDDSGQGFANDKAVGDDALSYLFFNAGKLVFHPKKRIVLPAITLGNKCYQSMFSGCTGLTELPADLLPATTLAADCYHSMFSGCTGLTSLPEKLLPATTLKTGCYDSMFRGCTGLETLPADLLPATTLAMDCYKEMFHGCTGLTVAPDLPAPKLNEGCYSTMFYGCTKLSSVKCLATTVFGSAFDTWLNGAGTAEGCERILYVDPATNYSDNDWKLDSSGEDGKRWTTEKY